MERDQGGRASGANGQRWPLQAQDKSQPSGGNTGAVASAGVHINLRQVALFEQIDVIGLINADKDAGRRVDQCRR